MNQPRASVSQGGAAIHASQGIQSGVLRARAARLRLQRESRMLEMALEDLREEAASTDASEKDVLRAIESAEQELVRCLIWWAVHGSSARDVRDGSVNSYEEQGTVASSEKTEADATTCATLCSLLEGYKEAQDAFTHTAEEDLTALREEVRQARTAEMHRVNLLRNPGETDAEAQNSFRADAVAGEIDLLREMTAEVNQEIDATLLEYGAALFFF
ncbi:hypothetical protein ABB37_01435 [Leptomonas pyrrhocoris]|uniref:Uncharacterized protein n=1 Tax=Leptomonas pyrrhocoris TaxID=157538 RepID=A0A0M9G8R3_LEPPY|nr:hypothetical protein ABB37_01435 [Leptomonas pyrrhocoris]KPA85003.1 hypothetical protein ABB37_01435 [Leptomonas pyrrhocoris]|eukprot:XP_015663442.1 hypothetical protein ABB37_01435 [Leptomonas pyrrhocoris]